MTDITREEWDRLVKDVTQVKTALVGLDGASGLCQKVEKVCISHEKLQGNFRILVGILIGSGVLTGSAVGILKVLGG